jgi:hypothetical protein
MKRDEKTILDAIRRVESDLSPENLTHDGELPKSQVTRRRHALLNERGKLVVELGREPTMQEIWGT